MSLEGLALLICDRSLAGEMRAAVIDHCQKVGSGLVFFDNPRAAFMALIEKYFSEKAVFGISPHAIVHASAQIDPTATVSAGCVIGPSVSIGARTIISENCVVKAEARIGEDCFIAPGVCIGQRGFGYERKADGSMQHFHHVGSIIIGNNVEIGANTCIDRGTIDDTIIHNGVKIDNLCHISHNVEIMEHAVVIANSMIGGSVKIGARAWLAPSVSIINGVEVGAGSTVGMCAAVVKPVPGDITVAGSPAVELSEFLGDRKKLKFLLDGMSL